MPQSTNLDRAEIGHQMMDLLHSLQDTPEANGRRLMTAYCRIPGQGDPHDLRANAVDILTNVAHHAERKGIDVDAALEAMDDLPSVERRTAMVASVFVAMRAVLRAEGLSWDDAMWSVQNHLAEERSGASGPSL